MTFRAGAVVVVCLTAVASLGAEVPQIIIFETAPIIPDLMGGCSLKCAFPWTATATTPAVPAENAVTVLNDDRADTAWSTPGGVGAKVIFHFPKSLPAEMDGQVPMYGIDIINGDCHSLGSWKACAHLKKVRLYYNTKPMCDLVFKDTLKRWSKFDFPDVMIHSGDTMTMEVLEVYPGAADGALAITEIMLEGAH